MPFSKTSEKNEKSEMRARFIVDTNVGKLARWLRMMGYDTLFINPIDDEGLIAVGLKEKRVLLTKDTQIMICLLYTSPSPRDRQKSRMPSSA